MRAILMCLLLSGCLTMKDDPTFTEDMSRIIGGMAAPSPAIVWCTHGAYSTLCSVH